MKKMAIWLGISTLLVGLTVLPTISLGETITSSEENSSNIPVTSEAVSEEQSTSSAESKTKKTENSTESSRENRNSADSSLTISSLSYDFVSKTISGKTAPRATVYATIVYDSNGIAEPSATAEADNNGHFSINHLFDTGRKISLTAQLNDVLSEPTTFIIPNDPSLTISNLSYDFATKTVSGKTAPGAEIYATLSANKSPKVDGLTTTDKNGNFSFVGQFSSGQEVMFIAYLNGASGEEISYTIPTKAATLTISDLSYDHDTGTLSGKTAPHAAVGLTMPTTMGQARVMSDENGYFSYKEAPLAPGTVLTITAYLGDDYSETVSFTIPEKTASSDTTINTKPIGKTTKNLPKTGENKNFKLVILGFLTILSIPFIYKKII
ncbi:hypothetical protein A5821_000668 [Enterococcus sp. 7F3_DIV0205]|uniref:Gram-positive cocci surface proteins LPxTG domain-containing protein n=1 Tax=Candidatus Enterococcus palustris TaxID=1834189 RepID=A0AAQ3Y511_9ENTE|nr:LPXTG cell wall anchor domain-containing protein [Enterococcus sp. 7F3_DIV0205]OTN85083.1 hypothetical protein A5821_001012 [Enterococcus sp. 7F3_DIV0205]